MLFRVVSSAVLLAFVALWTSITVAADYFTVSSMVLQMQMESWPSVQGTITRSEVDAVRSNKTTTYGLKVAYTYSVDGQQYEGSKARPSMWRTGDRGFAEELVARYPLGATIPVYYRPGQPSEAVLETGMDGSQLFTLMLLMPFNLVMLWLGTLVVGAWKPEPPLLSTFFREDGSEYVTLEGPWTATWVSLVLVGTSLACVALAGLTVGLHAPLPVAVGAWGVVIVSGVLVGRWSHARVKAGHYDLRLHPQERSLSLPPFSERKHRLAVQWRDVRSLRVEPQAPTRKGGQVSRYHLTLELSTADGGGRQEAIAGFPRQEQAEALAGWLRTRLELGAVVPGERSTA